MGVTIRMPQLICSIDLKNEGKVSKGPAKKAGTLPLERLSPGLHLDVTMNLTDGQLSFHSLRQG